MKYQDSLAFISAKCWQCNNLTRGKNPVWTRDPICAKHDKFCIEVLVDDGACSEFSTLVWKTLYACPLCGGQLEMFPDAGKCPMCTFQQISG